MLQVQGSGTLPGRGGLSYWRNIQCPPDCAGTHGNSYDDSVLSIAIQIIIVDCNVFTRIMRTYFIVVTIERYVSLNTNVIYVSSHRRGV